MDQLPKTPGGSLEEGEQLGELLLQRPQGRGDLNPQEEQS